MGHAINFEHFYHALQEISASLHSGSRVNDVLEVVVRNSAQALNAKGALIRLVNLEKNELELFAAYGLSQGYLTKGQVSRENIVTDLYQCRPKNIVLIHDILNDPHVQYPQEAWQEGIRMWLDAPLILGNEIIGILRVFFSEVREFSEEELNFVIPLAEQGAFAIEKAQLIERQRTQYDQLALQTEKLSALGRMAAGIAHEINNPLAGILLFSSNLLKKASKKGPFREGLEIIIQETLRCKIIIQELLEFSRESTPQMGLADINTILDRSLHMLENEFRLRRIQLKKQLGPLMPSILVDQNQIQQVLVNLLLNAMQAIQDQGLITVRSYVTPDQKRVRCEIQDNGPGIDPQHMAKIFEPFFTTKSKGTGLGLAVSYGIIQKHEGRISASCQPGEGTLFTLDFPIPSEASLNLPTSKNNETH